jgi:hypothetical protein
MATIRQIINDAYSSAGLASFTFDLSAEEVEAARRALDVMLAQWNMRGVRLSYAMSGNPDDESGLPDWALEAISLNLGLRLAGRIGKQVMPETKTAARQAYNTVLGVMASPPVMQLDNMALPAGAGHKPGYFNGSAFLDAPQHNIATGPDGSLDFGA